MALSKQREKEKRARASIYKALQEYKRSKPVIPEFQDKQIPVSSVGKDKPRVRSALLSIDKLKIELL